MKKCAVLYTNRYTGEEKWADSFDERGCSYCLRPRASDFPRGHADATEFYGKNRIARAEKLIENDRKHRKWYGWEASIVEYESEPNWFFELQYVLSKQYGDSTFKQVPKRFPLRDDIVYCLRGENIRPLIGDLCVDELQRFYEWRKANYKGKIKEVV